METGGGEVHEGAAGAEGAGEGHGFDFGMLDEGCGDFDAESKTCVKTPGG